MIIKAQFTKNLFISTKPSAELSDYALKLAKAHIANNNFEESEKWILFAKNYLLMDLKNF